MGGRYSLDFSCTSAHARAREDVLELVSSLGAHAPTSASLRHALQYLSPAKGYDLGRQQKSILQVCGMEAKPAYMSWSVPSVINVDSDCLDKCLLVQEPRRLKQKSFLPNQLVFLQLLENNFQQLS